MSYKTPQQLIDELVHARAAHARARAALDRARDRLGQATCRAAAHRAQLAVAKDWTRLGDAANLVGAAMRASMEVQSPSAEGQVAA